LRITSQIKGIKMPIYEYRCQRCGAVSEIFTGIGELNDTLVCKSCGDEKLVKLISSPGITAIHSHPKGKTCCGREERCEKPPCSGGEVCRRD
jgi:putative FmdB family regulatory protein